MKGFFVSTVGLNTKVVEDYIRNQEKEDMVQDNLSTKEHIDPFKGYARKSLDTTVSFHKPLEGLVKYRPLYGSLKTARFTCGLLFI